MKLLLDTHYLIWTFLDTSRIGQKLHEQILNEENEVYYSQASLWEIAIKYSLGKLVFHNLSPEELFQEIEDSFLKCRTLRNEELITFYKLPQEHKDPFDRLMIWQCIQSDLIFVSADSTVSRYKKYGLKVWE